MIEVLNKFLKKSCANRKIVLDGQYCFIYCTCRYYQNFSSGRGYCILSQYCSVPFTNRYILEIISHLNNDRFPDGKQIECHNNDR